MSSSDTFVQSMRVSATKNSLGHLQRLSEVPKFHNVISRGSGAVIRLREDKQKLLAVLQTHDEKFYVLSVRTERGSALWFHVIEQAKRLKLDFAGYFTCEPSVMEAILQHDGSEDSQTERKLQESNKAVIASVVGGSEQIAWFKQLVELCMDMGATDMHIEVREAVASVRIRRDGVMREIREYFSDLCTQAIGATYTLIAEERSRSEVAFNVNSAQSAMIPMVIKSGQVNLRYQSYPAVGGYDVVIRILKTDSHQKDNAPTLEKLGYTPDQVDLLLKALASSSGGLFIAGVTGSGKTTTLSAMLARLSADGNRKIISIEDPVEYVVPGGSHLSVQRSLASGQGPATAQANPFSASMMAFLRMDPDIGMFGEIRDAVSGQMAYTAIQTGHKLLTTVHATSALGIVARLTSPQIGLLRSDICAPEFFSALVYQTLVPTNCIQCAVPAIQAMTVEHLMMYEQIFEIDVKTIQCASQDGCSVCCPPGIKKNDKGHNGIKGMKVSAEVITPDVSLLDLLRHNEDLKAFDHWRRTQSHRFDQPQMRGKPSWAHTVYDITCGKVDPYYFEHVYGYPNQLLNR